MHKREAPRGVRRVARRVRTVCEADLYMDDSVNELIILLPETAMGVLCNSLVSASP